VSRTEETDLTLPEIKQLATLLRRMEVSNLVLTGGEPFIRKDIIEIARTFRNSGLDVRFQTNGFLLTPEVMEELHRVGADAMTVSLDSLNPDIQDRLTGYRNSHEKIFNALSFLTHYGSQTQGASAINTVVSKLNVEELPALARFATDLGLLISFIPIHSAPPDAHFIIRKENSELTFTEKEFPLMDRVYSELISMKKQGYLIYNSTRFLMESPDFLKYKRIHWKCESPYLYFAISPSGHFLPCVDLDSNIDMLGGDFSKNYSQGIVQTQVRKSVDVCEGCMYACWPEFTYLFRDFRTLLEQAKQFTLSRKDAVKPFTVQGIKCLAEEVRHRER